MAWNDVSRRVRTLKPSVTVAVANRAKAMRREGRDVLAFTLGEPDFDTPEPIKRAAIEALLAGQTKYMPTLGDEQTRAVIADKLERENGIAGLSGEHVGISSGGKHSLFVLMHCLLDPPVGDGQGDGDGAWEVVIPTPAWVSYAPIAELAGGRVVEVPTTPDSGFKMAPEQLERALTARTRVVVLNSPSNPCGTMYTPEEVRAIGSSLARAIRSGRCPDAVVISDEIYEKIVYGGIEHLSIGSLPEIADRVVTVNGLSKAYAMTGWRLGYAAMPGEFGARLIGAMGTLQGQMTTNVTSFCYPAIRVALTECGDEVERMRRAFAERAGVIADRLARIETPTGGGLGFPAPTGAFYVFPDVSGCFETRTPGGARIDSALSFCEALLEEQLVALIPGEDFGGCGGRHARISFACGIDQIHAGMDRIERFVGSLRPA